VFLAASLAFPPVAASASPSAEGWGQCWGYSRWNGTWGGEYVAWYPTEGYGTYDTTCTLRYNPSSPVRGEGVRVLQQALNLCYSARLRVDGVYGSTTATAVADARNAEGWDGRYDDYENYLRAGMRWPNWHSTSTRGWHHHCIDNSLTSP